MTVKIVFKNDWWRIEHRGKFLANDEIDGALFWVRNTQKAAGFAGPGAAWNAARLRGLEVIK